MTQRHKWREDNVKRHREMMVIYKPRRQAQKRAFPNSPQKKPTLPAPFFWTLYSKMIQYISIV